MTRVPYGNDYTLTYTLYTATGSAVAPTTITAAVTNSNGSAVTLSHSVTTSGTVNYLELASAEVTSSAYATRWTIMWTGTYGGADFTDVESLIVVKPGQEEWHTTVCEVKELIGISDSTDDDDIAYLIEQATDAIGYHYELPTVPKVTEARKFTMRDDCLLLFDECSAITAVADSSGNSLDYTILYGKRPNDLYRGVLLDTRHDGQVTVTGTWGYDNTPGDVLRALNITISTWYKRAKLGDSNDVIGGFSTLPREAKDLMDARERASI